MGWLALAAAIAPEIGATLSLRMATTGESRSRRWYAPVVVGSVLAFAMLSASLSLDMPLGVAYGIWAAAGVAITAVLSRILFDEPLTLVMAGGRRATPAATLAAFDGIVTERKTPPAPAATRLDEAIVHGEDVRRPLGLRRQYPLEHVLTALRFQLRTSVAMGGGRQRAAGLRLVATDADLSSGTGSEVRGTALALLLFVSGRPVEPMELTGPGADAFSPRP